LIRRILNNLFFLLCFVSFFVAVTPLVSILGFVISNGLSVINIGFLTENPSATGIGGGIANAIVGSFVTVSIASLLGVPLGLVAGTYVSEFRSERYSEIIRFVSDVLVGIPSVVTGILVYSLVVVSYSSAKASELPASIMELAGISTSRGFISTGESGLPQPLIFIL
jgi:phosphate transport system permease protein